MKKMLNNNAKNVKSAGADFCLGALYLFKALRFFTVNPRYWRFMVVPVLINMVLYTALFYLLIGEVKPMLMKYLPATGDWNVVLVYLYEVFLWFVDAIFIIITCLVILFSFTMAYSVLACPFLDRMSIQLEADRYKFIFDEGGWKQAGKDIWMSMKNNIWLNGIAFFWMIVFFPLNFIIPVVGFLPGFLFASYYFGLSFLIYSAEHRRIHRSDFSTAFKSRRWLILVFGVVVYGILPIPFLAIIFLPIAVLAGTMLYNEQLDPPQDRVEKQLEEAKD